MGKGIEGLVVADVDSGLRHVPDRALDQLTRLLFLDKTTPSREWLLEQQRQMKKLDGCLVRPCRLVERLAIRMGKHGAPFAPERANLCLTHKPLDPRVIRKLMVLVADECTVQVDRFRRARARDQDEVTPAVRCWVERMDSATALWLAKGLFEQLFDREACTAGPRSERSRCEACIMAVVGATPQMLVDVRASLIARRDYYCDAVRGPVRPPRLLRAVESWLRLYSSSAQRVLREQSEALAAAIVALRRRRRDAAAPRRRRRLRRLPERTPDGLSVPRPPRVPRRAVSQSTFLSTAASSSAEKLAMVGRRRRCPADAMRPDEPTCALDPRAWLDGLDQDDAGGRSSLCRIPETIAPSLKPSRS